MYHVPNSCALWLTYGCFKEDNTVIIVNLTGFLLFISYTFIYFVYTTDKVLICNLQYAYLYDLCHEQLSILAFEIISHVN